MEMILKILAITFLIQSCTLFEKDERILSEHKMTNGYKINIYYIGLGATTNDVIQVRKSGSDTPIWVGDRYNFLKASELLGDTSLRLVLTDTGHYDHETKVDTVIINIK